MASTPRTNLAIVFNDIVWSFNFVITPIFYILGNVGNCLNLWIFSQASSRANSCLLYFLSASAINVFILNFGLVLRILRGIWSIDPALSSLWFCRWRTYLTSCSFLIYRSSILLACIDRMCASSRSAWMRQRSRPRVAHALIACNWSFCCIYFAPALVFQTIIFGQCLAPPGSTYATYLTISTLIQGLSIPLAMIVCGIITFTHLKSMQRQVIPTGVNACDERQVVGQYVIMLLLQVVTDCLSNFVYSSYLIFSLIYPAPQSPIIATISSFLINMSFTLPYLNYSAAFYLHTLSSRAFRRKLVRLLQRIPYVSRLLPINDDRLITQTIHLGTMYMKKTTVANHETTHY